MSFVLARVQAMGNCPPTATRSMHTHAGSPQTAGRKSEDYGGSLHILNARVTIRKEYFRERVFVLALKVPSS